MSDKRILIALLLLLTQAGMAQEKTVSWIMDGGRSGQTVLSARTGRSADLTTGDMTLRCSWTDGEGLQWKDGCALFRDVRNCTIEFIDIKGTVTGVALSGCRFDGQNVRMAVAASGGGYLSCGGKITWNAEPWDGSSDYDNIEFSGSVQSKGNNPIKIMFVGSGDANLDFSNGTFSGIHIIYTPDPPADPGHVFTLSASGNTLTATCTAGHSCDLPGRKATLTLQAGDGLTDGEHPHHASLLPGLPEFNSQTGLAATYSVSYKKDGSTAASSEAPSGEGCYTAVGTVTIGTVQYLLEKRFTLTLQKRNRIHNPHPQIQSSAQFALAGEDIILTFTPMAQESLLDLKIIGNNNTMGLNNGVTIVSDREYVFSMPDEDVYISATFTPFDPAHFRPAGDTYTIYSATGWDIFCDALQDKETYNGFIGKTILLDDDIHVTRMAGSSGHDFGGTFDGQGKTLSVTYNSTSDYSAPFAFVNHNRAAEPACIRNLRVTGTITANAGHRFAGGLVGGCWGRMMVQNCLIDVTIDSKVAGDGTHGGIVGVQRTGELTIIGSVFCGSLLGPDTYKCGGIIGWSGGTSAIIAECLFTPVRLTLGEQESAAFSRNQAELPNCYYTEDFNDGEHYTGQGKHASVSENKPEIGAEGNRYSVSGIRMYNSGMFWNGHYYYYETSDTRHLTLPNTPVVLLGESKYATSFYDGSRAYLLPEGAAAYTAGTDGDRLVLYRIGESSRVIPAKTAVVILADNPDISLTRQGSTTVTAKSGNVLTGAGTAIPVTEGKLGGKTVYVLGITGEPAALQLHPFTGTKIPAGKVYFLGTE